MMLHTSKWRHCRVSDLRRAIENPPTCKMSRPCQSSQRLSLISSHLHRRADIALIGLAVMVGRIILIDAVHNLSNKLILYEHRNVLTLYFLLFCQGQNLILNMNDHGFVVSLTFV